MPRGRRARRPGPPQPAYLDPNAIKATVTLPSGEIDHRRARAAHGLRRDALRPEARQIRSWLRNGDVPKVVLTDPLQAHIDCGRKWTDADMHNMTAYLASLK